LKLSRITTKLEEMPSPIGKRPGERGVAMQLDSKELQVGHDNQVEPMREEKRGRKSVSKSLDVLADWWALSIQVWKDDPSRELALAFRETLQDIPAEILHKAFMRVLRTCKFRPTPAEIREAAETEAELGKASQRPKYLDEPITSQAEREAAMEETKEIREKLKKQLGIVA
jgi:hypothetical protein